MAGDDKRVVVVERTAPEYWFAITDPSDQGDHCMRLLLTIALYSIEFSSNSRAEFVALAEQPHRADVLVFSTKQAHQADCFAYITQPHKADVLVYAVKEPYRADKIVFEVKESCRASDPGCLGRGR